MSRHWIGIGEIKSGKDGDVLAAVLGSCVSIILWHKARKFAVMNHIFLPSRPSAHSRDVPGLYAMESWQLMKERLAAAGVSLIECTCHVVGGGRIQEHLSNAVGQRNANQALRLLNDEGVTVSHVDVGGRWHRKVQFDCTSGQIAISRHESVTVAAYFSSTSAMAGKG